MPWSEWFPGRAMETPTVESFLLWDDIDGNRVASFPQGGTATMSPSWQWDAAGQHTLYMGWQFQPIGNWRTYREWKPADLSGLVEGVDYAVRPDRVDTDTDAYVQYEGEDQPYDVAATPLWAAPKFLPSYVNADDGTTDTDMSVGWRVSYRNATSYPTAVGTPLTPWPGSGDLLGEGIASVVDAVAPQVEVSIDGSLANLTDVLSFTVLGEIFSVASNNLPPSVARLDAYFERPKFYAQPPRWRYWIPEHRLPLRQRQRDDGLGLSTARWSRGRSRQSSNRWRGYL